MLPNNKLFTFLLSRGVHRHDRREKVVQLGIGDVPNLSSHIQTRDLFRLLRCQRRGQGPGIRLFCSIGSNLNYDPGVCLNIDTDLMSPKVAENY